MQVGIVLLHEHPDMGMLRHSGHQQPFNGTVVMCCAYSLWYAQQASIYICIFFIFHRLMLLHTTQRSLEVTRDHQGSLSYCKALPVLHELAV